MSDGCGPLWSEPFAWFDPATSSWRTCRPSLLATLGESSSPTWPKSGTWDRGFAYEHPMSEPATDESGCSSLLPTPVAQDDQKQPAEHLRKKVASGAGEVITSLTVLSRQYATTGEWSNKLLPTPTSSDGVGGQRYREDYCSPTGRKADGTKASVRVGFVVEHLLPTPTVGDSKAACNTTAGRSDPDSKHHDGTTLTDAVRLLPTPQTAYTATDVEAWRRRRPAGNGAERETVGDLRLVVEEVLGATTPPPSPDTPDSPDAHLPLRWTSEDDSRPTSSSG